VNMSGAISSLGPQDTINGCYNGDTRLCAAVSRPNGVLTVKSLAYNVATNIYRGIDFESGYRLALSDVSADMDGRLDFRFLASVLLKDYVDAGALSPSTLPSDLVGGPSIRKWRYSATITYDADPITLVFQGRGFSSGVANTLWIQCTSNCPPSTAQRPTIDNMFQRGDFDVDTTFTYKIDQHASTYVSVQNWLNKTPPPVPTGVTGNNATYYDAPSFTRGAYNVTGRMFRVGLRFKM
jgi:iron complex outermembrane receptor protein